MRLGKLFSLTARNLLTRASIFGRIIPGILADKFGVFNMQALFAFASGIIVLALGLPARSNAAHITFAALYGFSAGAYVALLPGQVVKISKVEQVGIRVGVQFACVSFAGLIGNPIAGAIVSHNNGEYWGLNVFAGVVLLGGGFMFVVVRMYVARWKLAVRI
jgi:predicted MFS family arabinose efflux permease